jgi:hypothetical protein
MLDSMPPLNQPPTAICTACRNRTYNMAVINERCGQRPDGRTRCRGINGSALNDTDWEQCRLCMGGSVNGLRCSICEGSGWKFIRK